MTDYHFVSTWRLQVPIEQAWEEIVHTERWPSWWKYVARVDQLNPGDASTWCSPPGCPTGSARLQWIGPAHDRQLRWHQHSRQHRPQRCDLLPDRHSGRTLNYPLRRTNRLYR
jgi:hypothetical protein